MKLHRALLLGFGIGVALANCAKDPKTLNGTALYVNNLFDNTYNVRQLLFIGQNSSGNEVFTRDYRPAMPSATDLTSPQTVRILLSDSLADTEVTLVVYALDDNAELAEYGASTVKVALGTETDVTVNMKPFVIPDAGTPVDAGVVDAGTFDASLPDGGVATCPCSSTCCIPDAGQPDGGRCAFLGAGSYPVPQGGLPPVQVTVQFCGVPKSFCTAADFCDLFRANTCLQLPSGPTCSCGTSGAICPAGSRCADIKGTGVFGCTCDPYANCQGCCTAGANGNPPSCKDARTGLACGAAGLSCESCTGAGTGLICSQAPYGAGVCSNSATCVACTGVKQCCSGTACLQSDWPVCRKQGPGSGLGGSVCEACEVGKTSQCGRQSGQCACGEEPPCKTPLACFKGIDGGYRCLTP